MAPENFFSAVHVSMVGSVIDMNLVYSGAAQSFSRQSPLGKMYQIFFHRECQNLSVNALLAGLWIFFAGLVGW